MKIVYIASRSLDNIGGIETYMKCLCPILSEKGHDIILYTEGGFFKKEKYKNINIVKLPSVKSKLLNKILLGFLGTIHSLLFNKKVDIYHYNANASALFSFIPKLLSLNVVYQGHGLEWKRAKWSSFFQSIIKKLDDFVIFTNNNITMVSQEQSDFILKRYKKESKTITSGVNINNKIYDKKILNKFNILENNYILYLGRLVQEKKADILIEAYLESNTQLQLVITGDDPNEKKYINSLKEKAKKNQNIIFTGSAFDEDKEALLQNCKIFAIPSELEGLPITLLEAMSYKKVCIASDIEPNKEALGNSGIFFKVNNKKDLIDKINDTSENYNNYSRLEEIVFERIKEKFTWEIIANDFIKYYQKILEK